MERKGRIKNENLFLVEEEKIKEARVTKDGLILTAATAADQFRAINKRTGSILWKIGLHISQIHTRVVCIKRTTTIL